VRINGSSPIWAVQNFVIGPLNLSLRSPASKAEVKIPGEFCAATPPDRSLPARTV
jgi:hypothetical protein